MGLACCGDGFYKLLDSEPYRQSENDRLDAASASSQPPAAPSEVYMSFTVEVAQMEAWYKRLELWESQGGWHVGEGGGCVGFTNTKNTCWLNSGLQCLIHLRPLVEQVLTVPDAAEEGNVCTMESRNSKGPNLAEALREMLDKVWQKNHDHPSSATPFRIRQELRHYAPWLVEFSQQQDAQEFLVFMLDALHSELKIDLPPASPVSDVEAMWKQMRKPEGVAEEIEAAWAWAHHLQSAQSPIVDIFQGQLRSMVSCNECGHSSRSYDPFWHICVPVLPGECSLSDCLRGFASEEELNGGNSWHCEQCGQKVEAKKRMELYKLPPVVMLHLKRNSYDPKKGRVLKVSASIKLPAGDIDEPVNLELYTVSQQRGQALYDIIGIVNHYGSDNAGHYTAHCRHCVDGKWYSFDDRSVTQISASEAWLPESAYVLFLMKRRIRRESKPMPNPPSDPVKWERLVSFTKYVEVTHQSVDAPEDWPHMCNLVGIRRQLQLFNYMPSSIDLAKLSEYRSAYQQFRRGKGAGAKGELLTSTDQLTRRPSDENVAKSASGAPLPPPLTIVSKRMSVDKLAAFRTEYQRWRINARILQKNGIIHGQKEKVGKMATVLSDSLYAF